MDQPRDAGVGGRAWLRCHRAWYAEDDSAFYALAEWETREGARGFFEEWQIDDEPGETATVLLGDVGLAPFP